MLPLNDAPPRLERGLVLYWMVASRRPSFSFALQRARDLARAHQRPLVVLEALRLDYPHASPRLHAFVLEGMRDNARAFDERGVLYYPYLERSPGEGAGLVEAMAAHAVCIVTDDYPTFFLPRMVRALAGRVDCAVEAVDGNGLLPMRAGEKVFPTAHGFRRHLQRCLLQAPPSLPEPDPLRGVELPRLLTPPAAVSRLYPPISRAALRAPRELIPGLDLRGASPPAPTVGGHEAGAERLRTFVEGRLERYLERRHPDAEAESGLSPYLHFGHVGAHAVLHALWGREGWSPERLAPPAAGARRGFWGVSAPAEAFLDQLVTWRELGFNMAARRTDHADYASLPEWARATLEKHARDRRDYTYDLATFEEARTHDPLWNAAQRELLATGTIHGYLRMLWGKKILEWTRTPREAAQVMITLNDRHALDGRDPNSYSGIFWTLGRYDRPWGPERSVFGTVRYMSSANTEKKLRLRAYLERYGAPAQGRLPY